MRGTVLALVQSILAVLLAIPYIPETIISAGIVADAPLTFFLIAYIVSLVQMMGEYVMFSWAGHRIARWHPKNGIIRRARKVVVLVRFYAWHTLRTRRTGQCFVLVFTSIFPPVSLRIFGVMLWRAWGIRWWGGVVLALGTLIRLGIWRVFFAAIAWWLRAVFTK